MFFVLQNGKEAAGDGRSQVKNLMAPTMNENTEEQQEQEEGQGEYEDDNVDDDSEDVDNEAGHNRDDIVGNQRSLDVPNEESIWARVCF